VPRSASVSALESRHSSTANRPQFHRFGCRFENNTLVVRLGVSDSIQASGPSSLPTGKPHRRLCCHAPSEADKMPRKAAAVRHPKTEHGAELFGPLLRFNL
jgi:hypothetical protein